MGKAERILLLEEEMSRYTKTLSEAAQIIMDQDVSNYPIFVAHHQEINIGIPLIEKEKVGGNWNFHASSLEEFVVKKIIHNDKVESFKSNFKDPNDFVCVFVLSELGAKFVYIPTHVKS